MPWSIVWLYLGTAIGLASAAMGLFGWAMLWDRSRGRKRCPKCWYPMDAAPLAEQPRCPECGRVIKHARQFYRTRRRWNWAGASSVLLLIAVILAIQPKVQPFGWGSMTPKTILLLVIEFDPESEWALRGLWYQISNDLFHRSRSSDFLDPWDPEIKKAMWQWQWRRLGYWLLAQMQTPPEEMSADLRRQYRDLLALCRTFAGDERLRRKRRRCCSVN